MHVIDLGGSWSVKQAGAADAVPAQVPGCVHTDLLAANQIEDPFYRDNELRLQWIGEVDWIYTRTFTVPAELLQRDRVLLHCKGLDTFATLTLNGREIARTDNMFRTWEFDIKACLVSGENTIEIRFDSTLPYIAERQQERALAGWSAPFEVAGRGWVRKEPCNYGWDWGPALITCGIWRQIELRAFDIARLTDVHILQDHTTPGQVTLTANITAEQVSAQSLTADVAVSLDGVTVQQAQAVVVDGQACCSLAITDPQLWWPNNMGEQPLYDVQITLRDAEGQALDTNTKRIGLRTLRLDQHPDQWGQTFQFAVNGVPFFAKGANWIPADSFATRITKDDYRRLISDAATANMNMLRAWGGGIYEDDTFFELCDEYGICVWQDFLFACSAYPAFDDAFMASFRAEAEDNIKRIRHHACLAMWCGNNELEQGLVGESWTDTQMSWEDYDKLFNQLIPETLQRLDPERDYWPGSPHTPSDRLDFNNPNEGDAHLWDVWHGCKPFEWYRTCTHRFNSEFGFQSFPEPKTVYGYTEPQDRNVTTFVMEHHQRSGIGNTVIMQYMLDWFRLPTSFESTLWLSQILHGMAMKYAVEHWRRAMPRGMGTLYWQLNDCWPVASWASIDSVGRWKALQYMAADFYAPLLISGVEDIEKGTVELHVTSDRLTPCQGEVRWRVTDVQGAILADGTTAVDVPARANSLVETLDLKAYLNQAGKRNLLLWLELRVDDVSVSTNFVSFVRPKHLELLDPEISRSIVAQADGSFAVTLESSAPALWVWFELDGDARYSKNFFHMIPGEPITVTITPAQPMTANALDAQLRVRSLVDTYRVATPAIAMR